jgi:hypothetical protein
MTRYGFAIVRVGGGVAIGIGVISFCAGVLSADGFGKIFIPWGVAYLILGILMIFATRKI